MRWISFIEFLVNFLLIDVLILGFLFFELLIYSIIDDK